MLVTVLFAGRMKARPAGYHSVKAVFPTRRLCSVSDESVWDGECLAPGAYLRGSCMAGACSGEYIVSVIAAAMVQETSALQEKKR